MIVIGIDSHKRSHTAVAVDPTGRRLAEKTVGTTGAGHLELVRWAGQFPGVGPSRTVATSRGACRATSSSPARRSSGSRPS